MINRFDTIQERDRQQDRRTDEQKDTARRHRPRLCIASRDKKNRFSSIRLAHTNAFLPAATRKAGTVFNVSVCLCVYSSRRSMDVWSTNSLGDKTFERQM